MDNQETCPFKVGDRVITIRGCENYFPISATGVVANISDFGWDGTILVCFDLDQSGVAYHSNMTGCWWAAADSLQTVQNNKE